MKIAIIGMGRMGKNMAIRLLQNKHEVVVFNRSKDVYKEMRKIGAETADTFTELISKLSSKPSSAKATADKKIIWLMLPAGKVTDDTIENLLPLLTKGDIIVNGANAFFKNAQRQSILCKKYGVHLFDAGVSGGIWGLERGYALMIGGPKSQFKYIEPFCKSLAPKNGYGYFGESGAGHFVKSVHNIIEYTYLQGLAEGMELLNGFEQKIDLLKAAKTWQEASIVSSALLDWMIDGMERKDFKNISTEIGSVTIEELQDTVKAVKTGAPAFAVAVKTRQDKTKNFSLGKRVIAATRREFGGHAVTKR